MNSENKKTKEIQLPNYFTTNEIEWLYDNLSILTGMHGKYIGDTYSNGIVKAINIKEEDLNIMRHMLPKLSAMVNNSNDFFNARHGEIQNS